MPTRSDTIMGDVKVIQIRDITAKIEIVPSSTQFTHYSITAPNNAQLRAVSIDTRPGGVLQVTNRQNGQSDLREFELQATVGKHAGDASAYQQQPIVITISASRGTRVRAKMRGILNVS